MSFLEALHNRVLVCDGAMGSMLYDHGVFVNQSFEALNVTRPELVLKVHRAYVEAGADVIETNTFGANRVKLAGFGLADQLAEINVTGARLARQAVGVSGYVASSVGPLGVTVGGGGATTAEAAESQFTEQVAALLEGGVDLLLLETFGEIVELEAAVRAVRRLSDLPLVAQVATGEDGLSLDGVTPEQFAGTLSALGATMVGVNCGAGPAATLETVERIVGIRDRVQQRRFFNVGVEIDFERGDDEAPVGPCHFVKGDDRIEDALGGIETAEKSAQRLLKHVRAGRLVEDSDRGIDDLDHVVGPGRNNRVGRNAAAGIEKVHARKAVTHFDPDRAGAGNTRFEIGTQQVADHGSAFRIHRQGNRCAANDAAAVRSEKQRTNIAGFDDARQPTD